MKRMSEKGIKVMRLASLLWSAVIAVIQIGTLILGYIFDWDIYILTLIGMVAVSFILQLILDVWLKPIYRYRTFRYEYDTHLVTVRKGFIMIKQEHIPMYRIQNVDFHEGWIMRKYELATLTLYTAGGNTDVTLIDRATAQEMMAFIKQRGALEQVPEDALLVKNDEDEEQI
ncbi:PH domain-containing protein [Staphylococcus delphini]|uniref:PH domain-containing protein n=1 Tax=Staphylococcus delphini TaxID=53344 RepID=UPI0023B26A0E|nr:PH domain-containing protein [Staphylococcus delphini]MDE9830699.1 PH domain-containing protein [Staphylococcus delphini]